MARVPYKKTRASCQHFNLARSGILRKVLISSEAAVRFSFALATLVPTSAMVWPFGPSAPFQEIVSTKRAQRDDAIKAQVAALQAGDHLTVEEVAITSKSGKPHRAIPDKLASLTYVILMVLGLEIVKSIQDREFTSTQILRAFIKSAVVAHEETNCITEGEESPATCVTCTDFLDLTPQSCSRMRWNRPRNLTITSRVRGS